MTDKKDISDPVYKRIKFEVFEKDSFKCQSCGSFAPNVTLQLHRLQRTQQNENWLDPAFLSTFCVVCEQKQKETESSAKKNGSITLDELEERLEQLKMLINWRRGQLKIKKGQLASLVDYWQELVPGIYLNDEHKRTILSLMNKYTRDVIKSAMEAAIREFLVLRQDGSIAKDSFQLAFEKIPEICIRSAKASENQEIENLYHIHDILKEKLEGFFDSERVIQWLNYARSWEVRLDELTHMAFKVSNWTQFSCNIDEMVHRQKYLMGSGRVEAF